MRRWQDRPSSRQPGLVHPRSTSNSLSLAARIVLPQPNFLFAIECGRCWYNHENVPTRMAQFERNVDTFQLLRENCLDVLRERFRIASHRILKDNPDRYAHLWSPNLWFAGCASVVIVLDSKVAALGHHLWLQGQQGRIQFG